MDNATVRTEPAPAKTDLLPQMILLPWEDQESFDAFRQALLADLAPETTYQRALADRIVACHWDQYRSRRLGADVTLTSYRKAALHLMQHPPGSGPCKLGPGPDATMWELAEDLIGDDVEARRAALDALEAQGIRDSDIRAQAYLESFRAAEMLERRPGKYDVRLRNLMQEYRALQEIDTDAGHPDIPLSRSNDD